MPEILTVNVNNKPAYDIYITRGFSKLPDRIKDAGLEGKKAFIVTDTQVEGLYAEAVKEELSKVCPFVTVYAFPFGEKNKNLETVQTILKAMTEARFNRDDLVVALGGGVAGDIAGFCSAIYMRGIDVIQIPTTLLAQVDSSIGGKTGVDLDAYKNMVGAFKMPSLVYINIDTLKTLDGRQYASGMAEVLKYGLIMDEAFYEWLISRIYEINERDEEVLTEMIKTCCECKQKIVEKDPLEKGDRALLNFGHTIGHAIEKYKNFELLHGECVALGSVAAAFISWKKEKITRDEYYEIRDMFVPFDLPISIEDIDPDEIIRLTKSDKKASSDGIKFILLKKAGKAYIDRNVSDDDLRAGIDEIWFSDEDKRE
ncbi:MAG: 3-dehydroquinate synthase [Lachnospiraceae bacterium]|nr:3-dehydroquinate synthase [Lachnospiraceae bacterium]